MKKNSKKSRKGGRTRKRMRRREGSRSLADGARFLSELIAWGKKNGIAGIRPWAPELDWAMPWFDFDEKTKTATAKTALFEALKAAVQ